jgi:hypothetical protein
MATPRATSTALFPLPASGERARVRGSPKGDPIRGEPRIMLNVLQSFIEAPR